MTLELRNKRARLRIDMPPSRAFGPAATCLDTTQKAIAVLFNDDTEPVPMPTKAPRVPLAPHLRWIAFEAKMLVATAMSGELGLTECLSLACRASCLNGYVIGWLIQQEKIVPKTQRDAFQIGLKMHVPDALDYPDGFAVRYTQSTNALVRAVPGLPATGAIRQYLSGADDTMVAPDTRFRMATNASEMLGEELARAERLRHWKHARTRELMEADFRSWTSVETE